MEHHQDLVRFKGYICNFCYTHIPESYCLLQVVENKFLHGFLLAVWTLPWCLALWGWIRRKALFTWLSIIMRSYFSYHVFSSHINSTCATWRFEMGYFKICHCQTEANINIRLPQVAAYACPSKIRQSYLKSWLLVHICLEACSNSTRRSR